MTVKKQDYIAWRMNVGYADPEADAPSPVSRLAIWRAADDQPAWARPILLVITAISVFSYAWRASAPVNIEIYYAAAVRSMSMSWHDFFFGALDPAGTVTMDKLPGAFWVPAVASASVVSSGLGPFETPFEPQQATTASTLFFGAGFSVARTLPALEAGNRGAPSLMATQTSALAAPFIWASGREVLPIGGFTGTIPEPSLPALKNLIGLGDVHTFLQSPAATDPRLVWIAGNCLAVTKRSGPAPVLPIGVYYCGPFVFLKSLR